MRLSMTRIDYKILRVDEVSTQSSPVILLGTEAVIFCYDECQPIIRTLTFKPFTLRHKLQSGALQSWFISRVYRHVSLFTARDSLTPWWTAVFLKPVKQKLLLSMQTHTRVRECQKSDYKSTSTHQTNSRQLSTAVWIYNIICTQKSTIHSCLSMENK